MTVPYSKTIVDSATCQTPSERAEAASGHEPQRLSLRLRPKTLRSCFRIRAQREAFFTCFRYEKAIAAYREADIMPYSQRRGAQASERREEQEHGLWNVDVSLITIGHQAFG